MADPTDTRLAHASFGRTGVDSISGEGLRCRYHAVPVDQQSATKFEGRYTAP